MEVAVGALVVATALSTAGAYAQGQQQKKMGKAQADLAKKQAEAAKAVGERNAQAIEAKSAHDMNILEKQQAAAMGELRSQFGAYGKSPLDVLESAATTQAMDKAALRYSSALDAQAARYGANTQAWELNSQSSILASGARAAGRAGALGAASNFASGVASIGMAGHKAGWGSSKPATAGS